ncbi:hypothetical protein [Nocardiopsis sp. MG754419]|uniref:hypothetical protein n=1 Tax=Nocardiopsis sp. MG754419 TaxID=2259865 RepID=UPI001BA6DC6D|nr:hypothetical protein [Nocardiopsis sp. MG754419]MBR8744831.1 hypothetical protein [Nocardiopsis sp. MG754419]
MRFAIVHTEPSDPSPERTPQPARVEAGPVPLSPSERITAAGERLHTRAGLDVLRAHAGLNRLRHAVETARSTSAPVAASFQDAEPESGLETFRPAAFGGPSQEESDE